MPAAAGAGLFRRLAVFEGGWSLESAARDAPRHAAAGTPAEPADPADPNVTAVRERRSWTCPAACSTTGWPTGSRGSAARPATRCSASSGTSRSTGWPRRATGGTPNGATPRCLALAEAAAVGLEGPDQALWLRRLEPERANHLAALTRLQAAGDVAGGLRLAGALGGFWATSGRFNEAGWLDVFLDLAGESPADPTLAPARARALRWAGQIAAHQGQHKRATVVLRNALCRFRALGERGSATVAAGELGVAYLWQGSPDRSAQSVALLVSALHREGRAGGRPIPAPWAPVVGASAAGRSATRGGRCGRGGARRASGRGRAPRAG